MTTFPRFVTIPEIKAEARRVLPREVYNFGGRCELTNIDLTRKLLQLLGKPESLIKHVADRPGHDLRYAIDCAKAERELGYRARPYGLAIADAVAWFRAHGYLR